jgi:hypothetical protein
MDRTELARELAKHVHETGPIVVDFYGEDLAWRPLDYGTWSILTSLQGETDSGVSYQSEYHPTTDEHAAIASAAASVVEGLTDLPTRSDEPIAWRHTLHMELEQRAVQFSGSAEHDFGVLGEDFDERYTIESEPLYPASHIRSLERRIGELERTAFRKRRCPHCDGEFQLIADVDALLTERTRDGQG